MLRKDCGGAKFVLAGVKSQWRCIRNYRFCLDNPRAQKARSGDGCVGQVGDEGERRAWPQGSVLVGLCTMAAVAFDTAEEGACARVVCDVQM